MTIFFDMDGTIADLYGVDNWLQYLMEKNETPYRVATPLLRLCSLARVLNRLQKKGYRIGIISWLAKTSTEEYDARVTEAKKEWLRKHLNSVRFDEINIVSYGTPKEQFSAGNDILFDDEERNRINWSGLAYDVNNILEVLRNL